MDQSSIVAEVGTDTGFIVAGVDPRAGRVVAGNSQEALGVTRKNLSILSLEKR
ncbi:MAG TPA: hypothetical protein VE225_05200 [Rubrobacteraceae bacterium]|nr:hypothetical protein [Rubrobacteraceae bacterium]